MFGLPSTEKHYQELQKEFNRRLFSVYDDAKEIVEERAEQYDVQRPVWERVSFPHGFLHEITKKIGRLKAQFDQGETCMVPKSWAHTREDILDAANYLLFTAVYGDMLHDEMFPTVDSVEVYVAAEVQLEQADVRTKVEAAEEEMVRAGAKLAEAKLFAFAEEQADKADEQLKASITNPTRY